MPKKLTDLPQDATAYIMSDYLSEKDKSALNLTSKTTQALFQPHPLQKMANKLLLQVMHGEQEKAAKILKIHPELLTMIGTATDYSGRTFKSTAFRYALWALDTRYMCNMMLDCLPYSEQGEAIKQGLLTQFKAQAQDGLDYELNGRTINETHFNFSPIIAAIETFANEYDNWCENDNWDAMRNQWLKVVGLAQRYIPAHVAQHYCDPDEAFDPTPPFNKKTFERSLEFYNYDTRAEEFWFAAVSPTSTSGLGIDFGISRMVDSCAGASRSGLTGVRGWGGGQADDDLAALTTLYKVRTSDLVPLMQRLEGPIQKPDTDPDMLKCVIS